MLDDDNVLRQRDPQGALKVAATQFEQARFDARVDYPEHDGREITRVVVAGMGGSALAALAAKSWLKSELRLPFEVVRDYDLPGYVDSNTLVIVSSYSGNTEETLSTLGQARQKNAQVAIIAAGGKLKQLADEHQIAHVVLPSGLQPRVTLIYGLRALTSLLSHFSLLDRRYYDQIAGTADWLRQQTSQWTSDVSVDKNYAKQLALLAVGKTPVFYGGPLMAPLAYKWKISWNENAKNVAFWDEYPEFNHNEFIGWTSHPVEKPFAVFDLVSHLEHPRVVERFAISDRLLSGMRPKATVVHIQGDTAIAHMVWAAVLADFVSIYVAILNGVNPTPVALIETLKKELG